MEVILSHRSEARANKDWAKSDLIRDELSKAGITIKDGKDGASWTMD
jgi:cysteinyl-tRNA synthetase